MSMSAAQLTQPGTVDRLLRYAEVRKALDCSESTLARLCAEGRLTPVYIATRCPRIRESELQSLIAKANGAPSVRK
jgi:predicted site-specific integrase-resolvase